MSGYDFYRGACYRNKSPEWNRGGGCARELESVIRSCGLRRQLGGVPLQLGLSLRPVVNHLMAPVVGHLLPPPNLVERTKTSNAQSGLAIEGAHIDAR
ncbi:hypothetical protein P3T21_007386 [Paraburkholderia sp. GAS334]